jgi:hypothetical protein
MTSAPRVAGRSMRMATVCASVLAIMTPATHNAGGGL